MHLQVAQFHTLADAYSDMYGVKDWQAPSPPIVPLHGQAAEYPRECVLEAIDEFGVRQYSDSSSKR